MLIDENIDNNNNNQQNYSLLKIFSFISNIHRQLYMYVLELNNITIRFTGK